MFGSNTPIKLNKVYQFANKNLPIKSPSKTVIINEGMETFFQINANFQNNVFIKESVSKTFKESSNYFVGISLKSNKSNTSRIKKAWVLKNNSLNTINIEHVLDLIHGKSLTNGLSFTNESPIVATNLNSNDLELESEEGKLLDYLKYKDGLNF